MHGTKMKDFLALISLQMTEACTFFSACIFRYKSFNWVKVQFLIKVKPLFTFQSVTKGVEPWIRLRLGLVVRKALIIFQISSFKMFWISSLFHKISWPDKIPIKLFVLQVFQTCRHPALDQLKHKINAWRNFIKMHCRLSLLWFFSNYFGYMRLL